VIAEAELAEGQTLAVEIDGRAVLVCRSGGQVHAVDDLCPHAGARLSRGRTARGVVSCPLHGARFDLATGACLSVQMGLAAVVRHKARVADGRIEVSLSHQPVTPPLT
jgi:3-phenylpropionate/trans-cinnamate dioxygenase ferredoxin subunit